MRRLLSWAAMTLVACSPPVEKQYCDRFGVTPGTAQYQQCVQHFFTQDALFRADKESCDALADETYPRSLYDQGRFEPVFNAGFSNPLWGGRMGTGQMVYVDPDYRRNAELDALRMRIVAPCMDAKGWADPLRWQAGKKSVTRPMGRVHQQYLPWRK